MKNKVVEKGLNEYTKEIIKENNKQWFWIVCIILTIFIGHIISIENERLNTSTARVNESTENLPQSFRLLQCSNGTILYKYIPNRNDK